MRFLLPALLAGCLFNTAGRVAVAQRIRAGTFPTQRTLAPHKLERMWWNQATMDPSRDRLEHLVADEEVIVAQSRGGMMTVFDAETGKKLWAVRLGRSRGSTFAPVINDDIVLAIAGTNMHAIKKFKGEYEWKFRLPSAPSTSPAIDDNRVYVGARDGSVYAFDLRKIRKFSAENLLPQWSYQTMAWRYKAFKEVTTPPIATGRMIYFASKGKSLYAVTTNVEQGNERRLKFQFETDRPISAPLGWSKRSIFLASEDFKVYNVDTLTGDTRWSYNTGLAIRVQPYVIDRDVFIFPSRGGLHSVNTFSGTRNFSVVPGIVDFVAASRDSLYVTDKLNNLIKLRREDGARISTLPLRGFSVRIGNERTDRIIIARPSGLIACIREQGREFPLYHKFPERQPILPLMAPNDPPKAGLKKPPMKTN